MTEIREDALLEKFGIDLLPLREDVVLSSDEAPAILPDGITADETGVTADDTTNTADQF